MRVVPDKDGKQTYVRVVWRSASLDGVPNSYSKVNGEAFVGRGASWVFPVRLASSPGEREACATPASDQEVVDESGKGTVPAFVSTQGAEEEPVPPIKSIPCYVLNRSDLKIVKGSELPFPQNTNVASHPPAPSANFTGVVRGRIVRYDPALRDLTYDEDFVVRVLSDGDGRRDYVRIVWRNFSTEVNRLDPYDRLNRSLFVGRGPTVVFHIHVPEKFTDAYTSCAGVLPDREIVDASGKGKIPTFVATPGAEQEPVPPLGSLPCYVLDRGGMAVEK